MVKNQCCPHIENSQLIFIANQLTISYMREILTLNVLYNQRAQKCDKCSKTFCKIFGRYLENMQNQTNIKYSSTPKDIFKSTKKILKT